MRLSVALLAFALCLSSALAESHADSGQRFGNWLTACRTDGYCAATAVNPSPIDGSAGFVLRVGRPARQTYWEISFTANLVRANADAPFAAAVDRSTVTFQPPADIGPYGSANDFFFLGGGAQLLMDRLTHGKALTVSFTDTTGVQRQTSFSLNGLPAALIWIDTQQHRIGSERVADLPPYRLYRPDAPGVHWMAPTLAVSPP